MIGRGGRTRPPGSIATVRGRMAARGPRHHGRDGAKPGCHRGVVGRAETHQSARPSRLVVRRARREAPPLVREHGADVPAKARQLAHERVLAVRREQRDGSGDWLPTPRRAGSPEHSKPSTQRSGRPPGRRWHHRGRETSTRTAWCLVPGFRARSTWPAHQVRHEGGLAVVRSVASGVLERAAGASVLSALGDRRGADQAWPGGSW